MELKNKNILVVGLATTGVACARFLASKGAAVTVTDMRSEEALTDGRPYYIWLSTIYPGLRK